jgi:nucleoid-associated protein YgaU
MVPGVALSFLLVGLAAVALRPGEPPPTATLGGPSPRPTPPPKATPGVPLPATGPADPEEAPAKTTAARAEPVAPRRPEAEFTRVLPGEDLAAVARRVYGGGGDVGALWRANRDQLDAADAPLRAGMLLRTP